MSLYIEAYTHLEQFVLPGAIRRDLGGLPHLRFHGVEDGVADEFIVSGLAPEEAFARVQAGAPGLAHYLTVLAEDAGECREAYQRMGYRHSESNALMARALAAHSLPGSDARAQLAAEPEELDEINTARGRPVFHPQQARDAGMIVVYIQDVDPSSAGQHDHRPVSWGAAWLIRPEAAYIANMFTQPDHRHRGLGRAVLATLLHHCAQRGATWSLLVASQEGQRLYRSMGYRDVLACEVFVQDREGG